MIESYSKNPYKFLWRIWKPFPIATFSHILVIMGIPILCFFSPRFAKKMVEQLTMNSLDGFLFYWKMRKINETLLLENEEKIALWKS